MKTLVCCAAVLFALATTGASSDGCGGPTDADAGPAYAPAVWKVNSSMQASCPGSTSATATTVSGLGNALDCTWCCADTDGGPRYVDITLESTPTQPAWHVFSETTAACTCY